MLLAAIRDFLPEVETGMMPSLSAMAVNFAEHRSQTAPCEVSALHSIHFRSALAAAFLVTLVTLAAGVSAAAAPADISPNKPAPHSSERRLCQNVENRYFMGILGLDGVVPRTVAWLNRRKLLAVVTTMQLDAILAGRLHGSSPIEISKSYVALNSTELRADQRG